MILSPKLPRALRGLLLLLAMGCGTAPGSDRAGIPLDALPSLALQQELRIGSVTDPNVGFSRIGPVHFAADGTILVGESQDLQLRVYDAQGRLVRRIGGRGQGPGEFQSLNRLGIIGDTIWVGDATQRRVTMFTREGELLGTVTGQVRLSAPALPSGEYVSYPAELRADGLFLSTSNTAIYPNLSDSLLLVPRMLFDAAGHVVDTIAYDWNPISRTATTLTRQSGASYIYWDPPPPDTSERRLAFEQDSIRIRWVIPASPDHGTILVTRTTPAGDTLFRTLLGYRPRPVTPAYLDSMALQRAASAIRLGSDSAQAVRTARDAVRMPPYHPPVSTQRAGEDGTVWIRINDGIPSSNRWLLLAADGAPYGIVQLPGNAVIRWSGREWVWVVETDEFDVPWLVRYRLVAH